MLFEVSTLTIPLHKVVRDGNRNKVKYSIHDARTPGLLSFFKFLDRKRLEWVRTNKHVMFTLLK